MKKGYIKYLGILATVAVLFIVSMGIYNTHTHNIRVKGFESIQLVLNTDQTIITAVILDDIESYHKLRDMIMDFEPLDEDEFILHQEAIRKLIRALEDAQAVLNKEMDSMTGKETISL
jgi:hypothetical protein